MSSRPSSGNSSLRAKKWSSSTPPWDRWCDLPTMQTSKRMKRVSVKALDAPPRTKPSGYPEKFLARVAGREKKPLGDLFDLTNFGVNLTRLAPGAQSSLRHAHAKQDGFVYILEGRPRLLTN